jgi:hypothetical protein
MQLLRFVNFKFLIVLAVFSTVGLSIFGVWFIFQSEPIDNINLKIETNDEIEVNIIKPGDDIKMAFKYGSHSFDFNAPVEGKNWDISIVVRKLKENRNPVYIIISTNDGDLIYNKAFTDAEFQIDFDSIL